MENSKKRKANAFGKEAEELVSREYIRRGYTILERNWRLGKIEIDIIAQREGEIIIVEVKARDKEEESALMAVDYEKRRRMIKGADSYIRLLTGDFSYRFDIATCVRQGEDYDIEIYEDAFLAADLF